MTQLKFYKFLALGMLLLNLAMIAFFLLTKPSHRHKRKGHSNKNAKAILQFDDQQKETFHQLVREHKQLMKDYNEQQKDLLQTYFDPLISENTFSNKDSLLHQTQIIERKKIESIDQHLQDVKSILREDQKENFKPFVNHLLRRIVTRPPR